MLPEVPEYAKMRFHMMIELDILGKIRFDFLAQGKIFLSFSGVQELMLYLPGKQRANFSIAEEMFLCTRRHRVR